MSFTDSVVLYQKITELIDQCEIIHIINIGDPTPKDSIPYRNTYLRNCTILLSI